MNRDVSVAVTLAVLFLVGTYLCNDVVNGNKGGVVGGASNSGGCQCPADCKCGCQQGGECKCRLRGVHYQNEEVFGEASNCSRNAVAPLSMCGYCDDKDACKRFLADRRPRDAISEHVYQKYDPCLCCGGAL